MILQLFTACYVSLFLFSSFCLFPSGGDKEKESISRLTSLGGEIYKDDQGKVQNIFLSSKIKGRKLEHFTDEHIESVDFSVFSQVKAIVILGGELTDRSVEHLVCIQSQLEHITITDVPITDKPITKLLRKQRSLFSAGFSGTHITDSLLTEIATIDDLRMLRLARTKVSDKGLKALSKMQLLISLDIASTSVSDVGILEIKKMKGLRFLDLSGTGITDASIPAIATLPNLRTLRIVSTKITEDGQKRLKGIRPDLEIAK